MEMASSNKRHVASGFTLIEVLFSILVLSIGIMSLTSLVAQMENGTSRARFLSLASTYTSEKLEDLNRWPTWDPHVCVPSGGSAGSLASDTQASVGAGPTSPSGGSITCSGTTETINYYDDVQITNTNGQVCETVGAAPTFTTTCHLSSGLASSTTTSTATAEELGTVSFHRRWTIEMDQPITGVKRVTVLISLNNGFIRPTVTFQMSMVRP